MPDRTLAFASRPVVTLRQAAGSAAGLSERRLQLPSRLLSVFTGSLPARFEAGAAASLGQQVSVSFCR
jgi:hypothetical protein